MLTLNYGTYEECISAFLAGAYTDAVFVVKDWARFRELVISTQGVVNTKEGCIRLEGGKTVKFITHNQDKYVMAGWSFQYIGLIDSGLEADKMMYLISRMRVRAR